MTTLNKINKHLRNLGVDAEILSGRGYVYFAGPATTNWKETIVPGLCNVKNISHDDGYSLYYEMCQLNAF